MTQNITPSTTGKYLVLLREESVSEGVQLLNTTVATPDSDTLVFGELGVAVVDSDPTQLNSLSIASQDSPILAVEPEQVWIPETMAAKTRKYSGKFGGSFLHAIGEGEVSIERSASLAALELAGLGVSGKSRSSLRCLRR